MVNTQVSSKLFPSGVEKHSLPFSDSILNLEQGDPTMFSSYWERMSDKCTLVISGNDLMSYFSNPTNICWFMLPELEKSIRRLHHAVGNAEVEDRYIVVGTGSTQLYQAALFALCSTSPHQGALPLNVVCAAPFYSSYQPETDMLRSGLHKWAGDAHTYKKDDPFIEIVTSPNNPDGTNRTAVITNREKGKLIHDLAYYWPHYTPIARMADHDLMLFTFSKATGHAGSRIGWALVKDKAVASKMINFIEISSIGVSKESQLRAAKILDVVSENCVSSNNFIDFGQQLMTVRWEKLRKLVEGSTMFSLPKYPLEYCTFTGKLFEPSPAFAWLKCEVEKMDCAKLLKAKNIHVRAGEKFGSSKNFVRISMVSDEKTFKAFMERLALIIVEMETANIE